MGVHADFPWPCQQEKTQVPVPSRSRPAGTSGSLPPPVPAIEHETSGAWAQSPRPGSSRQPQVTASGPHILLQDNS